MSENLRKYEFSWDIIGDIKKGRANLGELTRVENYRLLQYTIRDTLEEEYGTEAADRIIFKSGFKAGKAFYEKFLAPATSFQDLLKLLKESLLELKIGIFRVEEFCEDSIDLIVTIAEDLDCSGLPELDYELCTFDEGLLAGIFESYTGREIEAKEIDCWCTGGRICRFKIKSK
jgi:hypothetical protein